MSEAVNWNNSIMFPSDSQFVCRVTKATHSPSKTSGNPMITLGFEVVSPEDYQVGDKLVNIAGVSANLSKYFTTKVLDDNEQEDVEETKSKREQVFGSSGDPDSLSLYEAFGLDGSKEDPENPNVKQFEGLCVYCQMSSKIEQTRKTPTAEQLAKAKKAGINPRDAGDIQKHPVTGKPMVKYWPQIDKIICKADATVAANKPY